MLRIGIVEDDIDALINVMRNLLALDSGRYEFVLVPILLSDPSVDKQTSIEARVAEYGVGRLAGFASREWPPIVQLGLLCPIDEQDRAEILQYLREANVDAIISDSWLGKGTQLETKFDEHALKLAGLMLLDDAEKDSRWTGKCWIMTMYQGDVFEQLQGLLEGEGWRPQRFNVIARFLKKDLINATAPGKCSRQLELLVDECLTYTSLAQTSEFASSIATDEMGFGSLIGRSSAMLKLYDRIIKVAPRNVPVVVQGESGVGKELVVHEIHRKSPRKDGPFIPVNCAAIPSELMESELFGRAKGGFTGASTDQAGLFEEANKGTIFLDEIATLSPAMQVKLLRVLQEGEVRRVGSPKLIPLDVRVMAATNADLETEVKEGRFRGDLLQRISVFPIKVPPLRDRELDIALLCNHFILKHAVALDSNVKRLSDEALEVLANFSWPWNVRQLENVIREALIEAGALEEIEASNEAIRKIAEAVKAGESATGSKVPGGAAKSPDVVASNGFEDWSAAEIWSAIKEGKVIKTLPEWSAQIGVPKTLAFVELMMADYRGYPNDAETRILFNSSYDACWKAWMFRNKRKKTSGKLSPT